MGVGSFLARARATAEVIRLTSRGRQFAALQVVKSAGLHDVFGLCATDFLAALGTIDYSFLNQDPEALAITILAKISSESRTTGDDGCHKQALLATPTARVDLLEPRSRVVFFTAVVRALESGGRLDEARKVGARTDAYLRALSLSVFGSLGSAPALFRSTQARIDLLTGHTAEAFTLAEEVLAASVLAASDSDRFGAHAVAAAVMALRGHLRPARIHLSHAKQIRGVALRVDDNDTCLIELAELVLALNDTDTVAAQAVAARLTSQASTSSLAMSTLSMARAAAALFLGDFDATLENVDEAVTRGGVPHLIGELLDGIHAEALLHSGRPVAALAIIYAEEDHTTGQCQASRRAAAYFAMGLPDKALGVVKPCFDRADGHNIPSLTASFLVRALAQLMLGQRDLAQASLLDALTLTGGSLPPAAIFTIEIEVLAPLSHELRAMWVGPQPMQQGYLP